MGSDRYEVKVLHYINPYLIWVLVKNEEEESKVHFEQIGIYGILPQNVTIEIDCVVKTEQCEQWMPAAVFVMKRIFLEASKVWFSPTYLDKKSSIFDDTTHKYGDLILQLKCGKLVSLCEELIESQFAIEDESLFHKELRDNNLNAKLDYVTKQEVIKNVKRSCYTLNITKNVWLNALNNQTLILQEAQQLESVIISGNFEGENCTVSTLLSNKMNDLKLCKDVDEDSAGRATSRQTPRPSLLSASLRKKLDILKAQTRDTTDAGPPKTPVIKPEEKVINNFVKENENYISQKGKKQRKINPHKKEVTYIGFGPAGLKPQEFALHEKMAQEEEDPIKKASEDKQKEPQKRIEDIYAKTDSEVKPSQITSKILLYRLLLSREVGGK